MDYKFPEITLPIRNDFYYSSGNHVTNLENYESLVFTKKNDVFMKATAAQDQHDVSWEAVQTCTTDELTTLLIETDIQSDVLLVLDHETPIGYIQTFELLQCLQHAYQHLHAYFQAILKTTNSSISAVDGDMRTTIWTKGAEHLFSIQSQDILGNMMTDFFPKTMLLNLDILNNGKTVYNKHHHPRDDLYVLINANPVLLKNNIIGAVVSETDITEQTILTKQLTSANETIETLEQKMKRDREEHNPLLTIKGSSQVLKRTLEKVRQVSELPARILINGESGTGKELFANAVHNIRHKNDAPFIAINCGAIPSNLFESELFGYEKGAFSGAHQNGKKGKFELASGGTLFLDEVGELPLDMQVKLLRVLQEGTYYSVGGASVKTTNCQIITATNKDLEEMIQEGTFREDLYYRLNIITLEIPPLRKRSEDIAELSHHFLFKYATLYQKEISSIPKEIMLALMNYHWPGNVRELQNCIERLVVFASNGQLYLEDLSFKKQKHTALTSSFELTYQAGSLKDKLEEQEKLIIKETLLHFDNNKEEAAKQLNVSRATLYNKVNKFGLL
ncbi:hypothetical protein DH09_11755 [Bacillaceae bacterium JMAK1]|nr:hypothetical protein DH09_11755 [Bacillaceae bacterium JMAK1]